MHACRDLAPGMQGQALFAHLLGNAQAQLIPGLVLRPAFVREIPLLSRVWYTQITKFQGQKRNLQYHHSK